MTATIVDAVMSIGFCALLWIAALVQVAVVRDRSIYDSHRGVSHRWIVVGGLTSLALLASFKVWDTGRLTIAWPTLLSMGMLAVGLIGLGLEKLFHPSRFDSEPMPLDNPPRVLR